MSATRKPVAQGVCAVCEALKNLTLDGRLSRHSAGRKDSWPPQICEGAGEPPVTPPNPS